nr:MAG TPA: Integrin beta-3 segment, integrin, CELL ADHESION [Caudoviricetes sp.]
MSTAIVIALIVGSIAIGILSTLITIAIVFASIRKQAREQPRGKEGRP